MLRGAELNGLRMDGLSRDVREPEQAGWVKEWAELEWAKKEAKLDGLKLRWAEAGWAEDREMWLRLNGLRRMDGLTRNGLTLRMGWEDKWAETGWAEDGWAEGAEWAEDGWAEQGCAEAEWAVDKWAEAV